MIESFVTWIKIILFYYIESSSGESDKESTFNSFSSVLIDVIDNYYFKIHDDGTIIVASKIGVSWGVTNSNVDTVENDMTDSEMV